MNTCQEETLSTPFCLVKRKELIRQIDMIKLNWLFKDKILIIMIYKFSMKTYSHKRCCIILLCEDISKTSPMNIVTSSLINENIGYIILLLFFGILYSLDSFQTYQNVFIMGSNIILKHMEGVTIVYFSCF